jgi:hypothetical protein
MSDSEAYSIQGGCLCGAVRFELSSPPLIASYCHCTRCQRRTGTGSSANAAVDGRAFRILSGADRIGAWLPPDGAEKCFCSECGAHIFSRSPEDPVRVGIRMSAFDSDPGIRPSYRQYVAYAAVWEPIPEDGLPRFPERRPPAQ